MVIVLPSYSEGQRIESCQSDIFFSSLDFSEISEGSRVKPPSEIYRPGDLLPYTLRGISRKCALLLGQCTAANRIEYLCKLEPMFEIFKGCK
jgi:hypothetical protein